MAAANELTLNPPDDWTGLPKLPDMLRVIHGERIAKAEAHRRKEGEQLAAEMRELEKQRQAGKQFWNLADVLATAPGKTIKPMPNVNTVWPDFDPDRNRAKLDEQRRKLTEKC